MKRLWWVRHAPTHAKSMIGWSDIPADTSDNSAFVRLSDALPKNAPIISSTLRRTVETSQKLANSRNILTPDPDLREIHFGEWEGLTFDQANNRDPVELKAFWEEPGESRAPAGESWNDLSYRVNRAAAKLLERPEPDIIVVAHFGTILCQVQRARRQNAVQAFAQKIDNLSLTRLTFDNGWVAKHVNQSL